MEQTQLQINKERLNFAFAHYVGPVLSREFSGKANPFRSCNRAMHPTAHVCWTDKTTHTSVFGRITTAVHNTLYDFEFEQPVKKPSLRLRIRDNKYRILGTVDYLIACYNSCYKSKTKVIVLLDSQKLYKRVYELLGEGLEAFEGLVIQNGNIDIPLDTLEDWGAVNRVYTLDTKTGIYTDGFGKEKKIGDNSVSIYSKYRLPTGVSKDPHRAVMVYADGKTEITGYESLSKLAYDVWGKEIKSNKTTSKTIVSKLSSIVRGKTKSSKDPDGRWFTLFNEDDWQSLIKQGNDAVVEAIKGKLGKKLQKKSHTN